MRAGAFLLLGAIASLAFAEPDAQDIESVLKRDFHARGQATMDRVVQDAVQRVCTQTHDKPPAELAKTLEADQMKTIAYPAGSLLGDWKRGESIAQGGRGMTWSDKPGARADGSCYNCHQLSPNEASYGTIGPSLRGLGKTRGAGAEAQRYVYGKIYNAKAYNLCSQMPRLGYSGTLTPEQIKDLVALLLDPASPVNK
jgi:L-cysteine S-thiosulfotransferase